MKSVQSVKNSLKFKVDAKAHILSVKIGAKKYSLPLEARLRSDGEFVFLSFPASSELYKVEGKSLAPMGEGDDATEAFAKLTPSKKRGRTRSKDVAVPNEVLDALSRIPAGYRLGVSADGSYKIVRTRVRRKV